MKKLLVVLLFWSTPLSAQSLTLPTIAYSSVMVGDWVSTVAGMPPGSRHPLPSGTAIVHESNPLVNWLEPHPKVMYVVGAALDVAAIVAIHKVLGKKHKKAATILLYSLAAARSLAIVNNLKLHADLSHACVEGNRIIC